MASPRALLLLSVLTLVTLTGPAAGDPTAGRRYALVVTVERYYTTTLKVLGHADRDGQALADVLRAGGWDVDFLNTDPGRATATLSNVRRRMTAARWDLGPGDTLLFAFVGHGLLPPRPQGPCLALRESQASDPGTMLPLAEVYRWLDECRADAKLVLLDACRPAPTRGVSVPPLDDPPAPPAGVTVLCTSSPGEFGLESDQDRHGLFMKAVVDGLGGAAAGPGRMVTWEGLREHAAWEVPTAARQLAGPKASQHPRQLGKVVDPGLVLLTVPPDSPKPSVAEPERVRTSEDPDMETTALETAATRDEPVLRFPGGLCASGLLLILIIWILAWVWPRPAGRGECTPTCCQPCFPPTCCCYNNGYGCLALILLALFFMWLFGK
jgi:hypothetical protein